MLDVWHACQGVMSVIIPGTIYQLVIAFIVVLALMVALLVARPYKRQGGA